MKQLLLIIFLSISSYQVQSQNTLRISGQIDNFNSAEKIYLNVGTEIRSLKLSSAGNFSVEVNTQQIPQYFYLMYISNRGRIEYETPLVWFRNENVEFNLDWADKSFQILGALPIQVTSEKIESLKGKQKIKFIMNHPNTIPSLYFAQQEKRKFAIADLESLSQNIAEEYENTVYLKRIKSYVAAKRRKSIKKRKQVVDFSLPNNEGNQVSVIGTENKSKLIALFSSNCAYSIKSISLLEEIAELNNNKIEMITIWADPSKETFLNVQQDEKEKITWTNLWDEYGFASTYLNNSLVPTFYVIGANGVLSDIITSYNEKTAEKLRALVE